MARYQRPPIIVDGRYPRSQSSRRNRWGMYVLLGLGLAGLSTLAALTLPWWNLKIVTDPRPPVAIQPVVMEPAIPPPPVAPTIAEPPPPATVIPPSEPPPKPIPSPRSKPTVDLDRVLAMLRSRETAAARQSPQVPSPQTVPSQETPTERPADVVHELVTAREMLMAGHLIEARDVLARLQTRMIFVPVTPGAPDRADINPQASRINAMIRAIEAGNAQFAIQTINVLLTTGLD